MDAMMRTEKRKQGIILLAAVLLLVMIWLPMESRGAESIVIRSISLKFTSQYGDAEILMPEVTTSTSNTSIQDVLWNRDISKWNAAKKERVSVILTSDSMVFANSYNRSECKISGANFVSAKALDNNTLEVKIDYYPVVKLGSTTEAGWSDSKKTRAVWKKVEYATGYQVALYADDKKKKQLTVATNTVDLAQYMDKDATYYYEVRAVGYSSEDKKYLKEGDYVTSDDTILDYEGDVSGTWKGNTYKQADGGVPTNCWKQILDDWYYFDGNGIRQTGWLQSGQRWYYLNPADGKMLTGWQLVNGAWYYMNPGGGEMLTGWIQPKPNEWYYLNADGSMASNTVVEGCWLDASGKWIH